MKIVALKETFPGEKRVPLIPASVDKLVKSGADITVESGIGETCRYTDADYEKAGAKVSGDRNELISSADMILPHPLDRTVAPTIAKKVRAAAKESA